MGKENCKHEFRQATTNEEYVNNFYFYCIRCLRLIEVWKDSAIKVENVKNEDFIDT